MKKPSIIIASLAIPTLVNFEKYVSCDGKILTKKKHKMENNYNNYTSYRDFKSQFKK